MENVIKRLLIVIFVIAISTNLSYAQSISCDADNIQSQLDQGVSVYSILDACKNLQITDFYGKNFAGGVIVYLDSSRNGEGIVSAKTDVITNIGWSSQCMGTQYVNGQSSSEGSGMNNTKIGCTCGDTYCAKPPKPGFYSFYYAVNSSDQGYTDWYLPSIDELTNAQSMVSTLFTSCSNGKWWSSTQVPEDYDLNRQPGISESSIRGENIASAFTMNASGTKQITQKAQSGCVRPFRSFGPWIDKVNPSVVEEGMVITITGSNFGTSPTEVEVQLPNGKKVTPQVLSGQITFVLPSGVTSGNLRIVVSGIQSNQVPITIAPKPTGVPIIESMSVNMVIKQDDWKSANSMTVYGKNFSLVNNRVTFTGSGSDVVVNSGSTSSPTQFNVSIPKNALTGPIHVSTNVGESHASTDTLWIFSYTNPAERITTKNLYEVAIDDSETYVLTVGDNSNIVASSNGGTDWSKSSTSNPVLNNAKFSTVEFSNIDNTKIFTIWGTTSSASGNKYYQLYNNVSGISNWNPIETEADITELFATDNYLFGVKDHTSLVYRTGYTKTFQYEWTTLVSSSSEIKDFASNSNKIISVGQGTSAYWNSTNSSNTPSFTSNTQNFWLNSVVWGEDLFVGVGREPSSSRNNPSMYYSDDSSTWTAAKCNGGKCYYPQLAVGYNSDLDFYFSGGHVLAHYYSRDGKNWTKILLPSNYGSHVTQINDIVASDDGFIFVGNGGLIGVLKVVRPAH